MDESTELRIDELKIHVQAILDEARRVGLEAAKAADSASRERAAKTVQQQADGHPDCGALHVLAAVANEIFLDKFFAGEDALDALLESIQMQQAADNCEASHS